jgi:ribose 1,5-bisphosphokinase
MQDNKDYLGTLFLIVGNSGSGKDSIIKGVVEKNGPNLKKLIRAKRYITRPSSATEDNYYITSQEFKRLADQGRFALKWHVYGLYYGIPIEIENWLKTGHSVIVNVSRTIIDEAKKKYKNTKVVFIQVPIETILKRLKNRARENKIRLEERIERAKKNQTYSEADFIVDNSGDLAEAINQLLKYIRKIVIIKE